MSVLEVVSRIIKNEVMNETSFVAIILNETSEFLLRQLSKIIRCVTKKSEIKGRFFGVVDVSMQRKAQFLDDITQKSIENFGCGSELVGHVTI